MRRLGTIENPLYFQPGLAGPMRPLSGCWGRGWGRGWQAWISKGFRARALKKGLFLQGDQDAQDDHYLGQDGHNMSKMIRLGCLFERVFGFLLKTNLGFREFAEPQVRVDWARGRLRRISPLGT